MTRPKPTTREKQFDDKDVIISKTDLKGKILYGNRIFIELSGYTEKELLGQPHSIVRHPDMPKVIFKLLWNHVSNGEEIVA
ncbi:MAG: PAS domain S-box protein, partial [Helicobacter sp.]|nr:PAS domain S-box protein [Helicobacter sp.]